MPSSDTWTSAKALKGAATEGRQRTWVITPHYGALPKDEKPVNGYVDTRYKTFQKNQFYARRISTFGGSYSYDAGPVWLHSGGTIVEASLEPNCQDKFNITSIQNKQLNDAIVKALVKMADAKVNVAVAYAEASKTSDLILDTARRVDRAYRAFRKGDLRGVARNLNITPKRLHKSWLEYRYGWLPLLMDVKGAAEFFAQQHVLRPTRFTVSASEEATMTSTWQYLQARYGDGAVFASEFFDSAHVKTRVKIWCELTSPHLSEMQQLGLTNPALVAWELVPFSFVFDWFVSVGDWLTATTAQQGVTIRRSMYSVITDLGETFVQPPTTSVVGTTRYETPGHSYWSTKRRYVRSIPDLSPFSLYPPVTNSFNFTKLVTSLALIQGNYRGRDRTLRV
jgi:hypothetical protein